MGLTHNVINRASADCKSHSVINSSIVYTIVVANSRMLAVLEPICVFGIIFHFDNHSVKSSKSIKKLYEYKCPFLLHGWGFLFKRHAFHPLNEYTYVAIKDHHFHWGFLATSIILPLEVQSQADRLIRDIWNCL